MVTSSEVVRLDWLLDDLVHKLASVRFAVVLSGDGLLLGRSAEMVLEDAEHFCAMASAIHSLARSAGARFDGGAVRQTVMELDAAVLIVTSAGTNACLAVLASEAANMGMVAYEMNQTVQRVGSALSAHPRRTPVEYIDTQSP